jgi:Skp family chaperone for outer membrane proteins
MKLLGILLLVNAITVAVWFSVTATANKGVLFVCLIGIFVGIFLMLSDRATEVSITGVGTIKAAVEQATAGAKQIDDIRARIEAQSATIDMVAKEARDAKAVSESLNEKNKEAEGKLKTINETLQKASSSLKDVETVLSATREYYSEAQLNMTGKPFPDGDIVFNTPISQALEGTYQMNGNTVTFKDDMVSEEKYRNVIKSFPKFPFSYWYLAYTLRKRNDASWRGYAESAVEILEKTTLVAGHHANHDAVLKQARAFLTQ